MSGPYTVLILDDQGCELSNTEYGSQREAISMAREKINEEATSDYQDWRTVEIRDAAGECVWDKRRAVCRCCGELGPVDHCTDEFPEPGDIEETGR
jgi:hypothetical protein